MMTKHKKHHNILWLLAAMGYGPDLLYWGEILKRYLQANPNTIFYSSGERRQIPGTNQYVENKISHLPRVGWLKNRIIPIPAFIMDTIKQQPKLIVISEFGIVSFYVCMVLRLLPRTKVLLLVESDSTKGGEQYSSPSQIAVRKFICNAVDLIMTNNEAGHKYLTDKLQMPARKIRQAVYLTSEPVKQNVLKRHIHTHQTKRKFNFLFVGSLIIRKGLHLLIEAVALLPPAKQAQLLITVAGDGPERKQLQTQMEKRGVTCCFNFVGYIAYEELAELYQHADVFVFPTCDDYRALVGFEAISYGLPLLHSKWDGAACEIVQEGENGFVIDPYDTHSLCLRIEWYIDNRAKLQPFRRRSKEIARNFTFDAAASNLIKSSRQCLSNEQE